MLPLTEFCDVVAFFVSEPDSTISPSEGVDGDLDLRDAMMGGTKSASFFLAFFLSFFFDQCDWSF
jgi:hypothetical protein